MNLKIMKTKYLMIATVAMLLTACSNDENEVNDGPVAAQVNAEIYNMATSRAYDDDWEKTDAIGISVASVANQGATAGTNVKYTRKSDNRGFEASSPIYFQDKEEVTFRAYYPFTETAKMTDGKQYPPLLRTRPNKAPSTLCLLPMRRQRKKLLR